MGRHAVSLLGISSSKLTSLDLSAGVYSLEDQALILMHEKFGNYKQWSSWGKKKKQQQYASLSQVCLMNQKLLQNQPSRTGSCKSACGQHFLPLFSPHSLFSVFDSLEAVFVTAH